MKEKLPPQAPEMERAVLGALLLEPGTFREIEHLLTPDSFYVQAHSLIWQAVCRLSAQQKPVDMLTVTEELSRMKKLDSVGGPYYIAQLTSSVGGTAHVRYHAEIIHQKAYARKLIRLATRLVEEAYNETRDIYDVQEEFEKNFTQLVSGLRDCAAWDMPHALRKVTERASLMQEKRLKGETTAIPTGLASLDQVMEGGWQAPELTILGARPSMGKTQFALHFAKAAAQSGKRTLIITIEMTEIQLVTRYLLEDERINSRHLRTGQMAQEEWKAMDETIARLWNLPIHVAGHYQINQLSHIKSEARSLKRKMGLDLLVIDYLGLVKTAETFERRYQELGHITSELKTLAKELEIPIIALCQLSRPPKGTQVKMPALEDLRESGNIEQDADNVILIHKHAYYDPESTDKKGRSWKNRGQLIIAKQREGAREQTITFAHDDRYKKISDE
ncbi:MAG: replicative DNA helicase [Tannerellaceae bacterium]|nr:replicative DNA helicase [Tannerellaceae bacterium]